MVACLGHGTRDLQAGLSGRQVLMRHSQPSTTGLYDYPRPDEFREAVDGLAL